MVVSKIPLLFLLVVVVPLYVWADPPSDFAQNNHGDLNLRGIGGVHSTPARIAEPGFGGSFYYLAEVNQIASSISGEFGNSLYRGHFAGRYESLDSIYRLVYLEWDASATWNSFVLGGGYGLSEEWIPGTMAWTRHLYKIGCSFEKYGLTLSAMGWNYFSRSIEKLHFLLGLYIQPGNSFEAFSQWDGTSVVMGTALNFRYFSLLSSYRFPGFSLGASIVFRFGTWSLEGGTGKSYQSLNWFGVEVKKTIEKKAIL